MWAALLLIPKPERDSTGKEKSQADILDISWYILVNILKKILVN
jgi:hypothetical protein